MLKSHINKRSSGLELLRIIAMLFVLLQHANFYTLGYPTNKNIESFSFCFQESITIIAVNLFILITGYFRTTLKGLKVLQLIYQCIFCVIPISLLLTLTGFASINSYKDAFTYFWPFNYWFIIAYIGLVIISPILNCYIGQITKNKLKLHLLCFYCFIFIFDCLLREEYASILGGYSIVWMAFIYLIGRYIKLYNGFNYSNKLLLCIFIVTILAKTTLLFFHINGVRYSNPTTLLSSIVIFVVFTRLNFYNKYINIIAASSTMVYLINLHPIIISYFRQTILALYNSYNHFYFTLLCLITCAIIFSISIVYDRARLFTWKIVVSILKQPLEYFSNIIRRIQ